MAVALVDGRIRGQAIEITIPFHVVDPHALGTIDHHVEGMIVVSSITVFELDEIRSIQLIHDRHDVPFQWQ
jgi:hypothetical protein